MKMRLDLTDRVQRWMYFGLYEQDEVTLLESLLAPGGCFLDIGANAGFFTLHGAALAGPEGQVHAFEPLPANLARLRETVRENRLSHVRVVGAAVSDHEGELTFTLPPEGESGWGRVAEGPEAETIRVPCVSIDSYLDSLPDPPASVDVVKLDVEGHEAAALRGMQRTLQRHRPAILMEMNLPLLAASGTGPEAVGGLLESAGYRARVVGRTGALSPYDFRHHPGEVFNILARPSEEERP